MFAGNLTRHPCFDQIRGTDAYRVISDLSVTDRIMRDTFWIGVYSGMTNSFLQEKKFDVINLTSKNFDLTNLGQIESVIKYNKADYLLHFAWITGGDYLSNSVNNILCKKIIY